MMRILLVVVAFLVGMLWGKSSSAVEYNLINKNNTPEIYCLAQNILFEASTEPVAGKIAVGLVVLNRVNDTRYPNTICGVVKQGPIYESWKTRNNPDLKPEERVYFPVKHRCQFSWYCDGKSDKIRPTENWYKSQIVALQLMDGKFNGVIEGATHYHASWVYPKWRHTLTYIAQVGDHLFYRWEK